MGLIVYLFFNGNCEEAMNFYRSTIGGTIESLVRYGDAPMPSADAMKEKVMHGIMMIKDTKVMCSDSGERKMVIGNNFSLSLDYKNEAEMQKVFERLSGDGGTVTMPLQDTFWGAKFGMCTDKFGVNWMFNHDKPKS